MIDQIFRLNLPCLEEVMLENVPERFFDPSTFGPDKKVVKPKEIFKREYLEINRFEFSRSLIFYRDNNDVGTIHSDNLHFPWAINWIYNGYATMEYWSKDQFIEDEIAEHENGYYVYNPKKRPESKFFYLMRPGAYLVHTNNPHQPSGVTRRISISSRVLDKGRKWEDIVEKFSDLIIPF